VPSTCTRVLICKILLTWNIIIPAGKAEKDKAIQAIADILHNNSYSPDPLRLMTHERDTSKKINIETTKYVNFT
jgi:hypothetical protein